MMFFHSLCYLKVCHFPLIADHSIPFGEKIMKEYEVFKYDTDKKHAENFKNWHNITNRNRGLSGEMNLNLRTAVASFEEVYGKVDRNDLD